MALIDLDAIDKILLTKLQQNSALSLQELSESVNLTTTPCWKRIRRLEEIGVISRRVTLLDPESLGLSLVAFVMLKTKDHSNEWYQEFVKATCQFPEVMEFYRMAGEYDYMMKVMVADMKQFDLFYKKLVNQMVGISDVTSTFAMESIKYSTVLPVD